MDWLDSLYKAWPAMAAIVALIVWLTRLESRSLSNQNRIASLEARAASVDQKLEAELLEIKVALARIETTLATLTHRPL